MCRPPGVGDRRPMELTEAVRQAFARAQRPGRVGVEVELIPVTGTDRPMPVDPALLTFDAAFVATARPSFEPGGQLELSPPPRRTVAGLMSELDRLLAHAVAVAGRRGIQIGRASWREMRWKT